MVAWSGNHNVLEYNLKSESEQKEARTPEIDDPKEH